jgi:hypothetical protein
LTYWKTLPTDLKEQPNRYSMSEIKQALREISCGGNIKKNLKRLRKNLWYLYIDGLIGHGCKVGTIRKNEKTGIIETPVIESRGIYGYLGDQVEPLKNTFEFAAKLGGFLTAVEAGKRCMFGDVLHNAISQTHDVFSSSTPVAITLPVASPAKPAK